MGFGFFEGLVEVARHDEIGRFDDDRLAGRSDHVQYLVENGIGLPFAAAAIAEEAHVGEHRRIGAARLTISRRDQAAVVEECQRGIESRVGGDGAGCKAAADAAEGFGVSVGKGTGTFGSADSAK